MGLLPEKLSLVGICPECLDKQGIAGRGDDVDLIVSYHVAITRSSHGKGVLSFNDYKKLDNKHHLDHHS